jgi:hypothetical protein
MRRELPERLCFPQRRALEKLKPSHLCPNERKHASPSDTYKSGGAFRRGCFALACRTEPLVVIVTSELTLCGWLANSTGLRARMMQRTRTSAVIVLARTAMTFRAYRAFRAPLASARKDRRVFLQDYRVQDTTRCTGGKLGVPWRARIGEFG